MNKKAIIITAVSLGVAGIAVFGGIKAYQIMIIDTATARKMQRNDRLQKRSRTFPKHARPSMKT